MPLGSIQSPILFIFLINNLDANVAGISVKSGGWTEAWKDNNDSETFEAKLKKNPNTFEIPIRWNLTKLHSPEVNAKYEAWV